MPRNTREWAQRKIDMACGNLETMQGHLREYIDTYADEHPELATPALDAVEVAEMLKNHLIQVRKCL